MSNKTIEKLQAQLNQLVTNCPELDQNSQWKELWANLEELSQVVSRQNLILETAADISNAASTILDVGEFLAFATNLIRTNFDFREVGIFLIDESHKWLELKATTTLTDTPFQPKVSLEEETTIGRAIYQQKPFISIDANITRQPAPATLRILTIPLISRGQTIGALVIQASKEYDLSKENIKAFQALADQLSNSIQNSLLFATTDRQLSQLITLHNINLQIGNHFDLDMLLQEVAQLSVKLLGTDACIIRLLDEDQTEFEVRTTHNLPEISQSKDFNTGLSQKVLETGQAVLINSWNDDPLTSTYKNLPAVPNAVLGAPITLPQKFLGVIEVYSFSNRQAFDESDLYTLSLLASQTAAAIDNTRLFNKAENSYRFLETVIEHIPDPIFIKDKKHTWMAMNQANADVIGYPKHNLIGKTDKDFFAQELAEEFYRRDDEVLSTNQVAEFEDKTIWGDGQEHTAYTRLIPIIDPATQQSEYLLGITHDITQRKAQEAEREHFLAETAALYKGSQAIANALSERQIYEALFEQIRLEDPCEIAAFSFEAVNNELIWAELKSSWQRQDNPTYPPETKIYLPDAPYSRLLTITEPIFIPDLASDPRLSDSEREAFAPSQAKSLAILPLLTSGQELGYIIVFFTQPYSFPEVTQRFWAAMIDQAGIALSNRRLIQEAAYRVIKMETAAEVAQASSSILDLNNLLNSAVNLIRDRFDLYYAGAFLVDKNNTWAVLRAGTGQAGKIQLKKNHRLKIGGDSMIGWSVEHRQPRIALDVGQEAVHFQNPDLPDTRSEMALPLIYRNRAIGALTVQSTEQAAFSREDIIFLQTMANQLANAIENARLFEQAQQEIAERTRVQEALRSSERKYRDLVENANSIILRFNTQSKITYFNEFAQKFFGYSENEILGQNVVGTIIPQTDSEGHNLSAMVSDIFEHPENYTSNENENILKNGERVWVSWANKAIYDDSGQISEMLCVGNDHTKRRNAENRIRQLLSDAQHRSTLLETAAEVSRGASSILDVDDLINKSVNLIRDKFDFYYVGLFLVDDASGYAVLRAGTGEAGQIQLENKHSLEIGGESMIGWCIENHKARIALDVGEEAVHFKNPILPDTHSEMALPLISRDQVIGALTVQSTERGAFSDDDITLLQTMADQLANALTNAYLFENVAQARKEAESRLKETEALQQLSQNLAGTLAVDEILAIFFEACTQEIGFEYVQFSLVDKEQNRVKAIGGVGLPDSQIKLSNHSLSSNDIMADIIRTGKTEMISGWDDRFDKETFEAEGHANWVRIFTPITLRQENIGLVEAGFNKHIHIKIQDTQIRLLQAFITQTALALDNAQRYEASQKAARREALIKEITTKVRASTDLDDILKTTVQEVGHAISNKRTYIQLVSPNKTNGSKTNGNTDRLA